MIGLDTNVLVRYIMQDDAVQAAKATALVETLDAERPGFVALVSIVELYWVLTSCYDLTEAQVMQALEILLRTKEIVVDQAEQVGECSSLTSGSWRSGTPVICMWPTCPVGRYWRSLWRRRPR